MQKIPIAIADDHLLVRQALSFALSQQFQISILFEAKNGTELIQKLLHEQPEVLLLDLKMPGIGGIQALKIINQKYPKVRVLILTAFIDEVYVLECLQYNIYGFLSKDMDLPEINNAIETAYQNRLYTTNLLTNSYLKSYIIRNNKNTDQYLPEFSTEEIQILKMLQKEKTTEEIADSICLSKRSIEVKRERMKEKAKVKTIGGLLLYALKRSFIE